MSDRERDESLRRKTVTHVSGINRYRSHRNRQFDILVAGLDYRAGYLRSVVVRIIRFNKLEMSGTGLPLRQIRPRGVPQSSYQVILTDIMEFIVYL